MRPLFLVVIEQRRLPEKPDRDLIVFVGALCGVLLFSWVLKRFVVGQIRKHV
jgi:hypothetical protein